MFAVWFPGKLHGHYRDDNTKAPPKKIVPKPGWCIYGHFNSLRGLGLMEFYPEARQCATFMREPFERTLSQWRYAMARNAQMKRVTFREWLEEGAANNAEGKNSRSFACQFPKTLTLDNIERVLREYFVFVGILERLPESIAALANVLGREPLPVPLINVTAGPDFPECRNSEYRSFHEKHFPVEHEAYAQGLKLNLELLSEFA